MTLPELIHSQRSSQAFERLEPFAPAAGFATQSFTISGSLGILAPEPINMGPTDTVRDYKVAFSNFNRLVGDINCFGWNTNTRCWF